jgi:hypothetical protein
MSNQFQVSKATNSDHNSRAHLSRLLMQRQPMRHLPLEVLGRRLYGLTSTSGVKGH